MMLSFCRIPSLFSRGICICPQPTPPQTDERAPLEAFRKMIAVHRTALSCLRITRSVDNEGTPSPPAIDVDRLRVVSQPMRAAALQTI
jgi:hypothetical protein